jgi:cytochrome b
MTNLAQADTLKVWDAPLRLFHWLLVLAILAAFLSSEDDSPIASWHMVAGWCAAVLLAFRLVWGLVGGEHARFARFIKPTAIGSHVRELFAGRPEQSARSDRRPRPAWPDRNRPLERC